MQEDKLMQDIRAELGRARRKFPDSPATFTALTEEVGELAKALLDEDASRVRAEAAQVAVMAMRTVLDGDDSLASLRAKRRLDPVGGAPRVTRKPRTYWHVLRWLRVVVLATTLVLLLWAIALLVHGLRPTLLPTELLLRPASVADQARALALRAIEGAPSIKEHLVVAAGTALYWLKWGLWGAAGTALLVGAAYWARARYRAGLRYATYTGYLQGAAWDLVRLMENAPRTTPGREVTKRSDTIERFAVKGTAEIVPKPLVTVGKPSELPDLAEVAFKLQERNEKTNSSFWLKANGIRTGLYMFLAIYQVGNISSAYTAMLDYIRRQRDEDKKGTRSLPNLIELKQLFGLPTAWPTGDLPEQLWQKPLEDIRAIEIAEAVRRGKRTNAILGGLVHRTWPADQNEPRPPLEGDALLEAMREYMR